MNGPSCLRPPNPPSRHQRTQPRESAFSVFCPLKAPSEVVWVREIKCYMIPDGCDRQRARWLGLTHRPGCGPWARRPYPNRRLSLWVAPSPYKRGTPPKSSFRSQLSTIITSNSRDILILTPGIDSWRLAYLMKKLLATSVMGLSNREKIIKLKCSQSFD